MQEGPLKFAWLRLRIMQQRQLIFLCIFAELHFDQLNFSRSSVRILAHFENY